VNNRGPSISVSMLFVGGLNRPQTMKMVGKVRGNEFVKQLGITKEYTPSYVVKLGDVHRKETIGCCRNLEVELEGYIITLLENSPSSSILDDVLHRFPNRYRCSRCRKSWTFYISSITDVVIHILHQLIDKSPMYNTNPENAKEEILHRLWLPTDLVSTLLHQL